MPRKSRWTEQGRKFLKPRVDVRKRNTRTLRQAEERLMVNGTLLTAPETKIYRALEQMKVSFSAQVALNGGTTLGGALVDFVLWDYSIVIEYQGPFHFSSEGQAKDFYRTVTRNNAGYTVVKIEEHDLDDLYAVLRRIIAGGFGFARIAA